MTSISAILNQLEGSLKKFFRLTSAKVNKTFVIDIMEVLLLYLILPQRINFTQLARFGQRGEQTYRNLYSRKFDWLSLNIYIAKEFFKNNNGSKAIAIDPSYISKSGSIPMVLVIFGPNMASCIVAVGDIYNEDDEIMDVCNRPMQIVHTKWQGPIEKHAMIRKIRK